LLPAPAKLIYKCLGISEKRNRRAETSALWQIRPIPPKPASLTQEKQAIFRLETGEEAIDRVRVSSP
jgi:hypothetical protein